MNEAALFVDERLLEVGKVFIPGKSGMDHVTEAGNGVDLLLPRVPDSF